MATEERAVGGEEGEEGEEVEAEKEEEREEEREEGKEGALFSRNILQLSFKDFLTESEKRGNCGES